VGKFTVLLSSAYSEFQAYSKGLIFSTCLTIEECISGSSSAIFNSWWLWYNTSSSFKGSYFEIQQKNTNFYVYCEVLFPMIC